MNPGRWQQALMASAIGLAAISAMATPRQAWAAQSEGTPLPVLIYPRFAMSPLANAGVHMPMDRSVAALVAYLDQYERALLRVDKEYAPLAPESPGAPRRVGDTQATVETLRRLYELDARSLALDNDLRRGLYAAFHDAVPTEDGPVVDACRSQMEVDQADQRLQGSYAMQRYQTPDDLASLLAWRARGSSETPERRRAITLMCAEHSQQRAAALRSAQQALQALAIQHVQQAQGPQSRQQVDQSRRMHGPLGISPEDTGPGTESWKRMLDAQLATYRAIESRLSADDRAALRKHWIPRMLGSSYSTRGVPRTLGSTVSDGGVTDFVRTLLRMPDLTDADRDRVRSIGRAWIADNDALTDRAF
ncbi:MAG: hypothetical protein JNK53_04045, partial [Phycisphaerae bacterium]|nr:hypothetical protein [Phycisphaerae bacterium]